MAEVDHPMHVAPYLLLRFNLSPSRFLRAPDAEQSNKLLKRLVILKRQQSALAETLSAHLYNLADGMNQETVRSRILPLRRDIHNGRQPRQSLAEALELTDSPELRAWYAAKAEASGIEVELARHADQASTVERRLLQEQLSFPDLQQALAVSSDWLPGSAESYTAADPANLPKRARKSEESLLRYANRAATKTSPFSRYTAVAFYEWSDLRTGPDSLASPFGKPQTTLVAVNGYLLRSIETALTHIPEAREHLDLRINPGLRRDGDHYLVTADRDQFAEAGTGGEANGEATLRIPVRPAIERVIELLSERGGRAGFVSLVDELAQQVVGGRASVEHFVGRLLDHGVLAAVPLTDEQDPHSAHRLADALAALPSKVTVELGSTIKEAATLADSFASAGPYDRVQIKRGIRTRMAGAHEALGKPMPEGPVLFEDVGLAQPLAADRKAWGPMLDSCSELLTVFQLFDMQHVFTRMLARCFVDHFGPGGSTRDLLKLAEIFMPLYEDGLKIIDGQADHLAAGDPALEEIIQVRQQVIDTCVQGLNAGSGELVLDPEWMAELSRRMPRWITSQPASYSLFLQPLGQEAAINRIYNGWGNYLSRFLTTGSPEIVETVRRHMRGIIAPDELLTEVRPVRGFNANIHPLLAQKEVDWREIGLPDTIAFGDLEVFHDAARDRIVLRDASTGQRLHLLYLGFLVPFYLPRRLLALTSVGSSGSIIFHPQSLAKRLHGHDGVRKFERIRYKQVLYSRAQWHVPAGHVPLPTPGEEESHYFVRVNEWRLSHEIPDEVFVRAPIPEMNLEGSASDLFGTYMRNRKPHYLDFLSRLNIRHLPRLIAEYPQGDLVFEEAAPSTAEGHPFDGRRHATEMVVELYRKAATP